MKNLFYKATFSLLLGAVFALTPQMVLAAEKDNISCGCKKSSAEKAQAYLGFTGLNFDQK